MKACPSDEELQSLVAGKIDASELPSLNQHIDNCKLCQGKLDLLTGFDASDSELRSATDSSLRESHSSEELSIVQRLKNTSPRELLNFDTASDVELRPNAIPTSEVPSSIEHYEIGALIGQGATGRLYLATDTRLMRQVALKVLHPTLSQDAMSRERLAREARASASLRHDHIVALHDFVVPTDRSPFLVMEHVDGQSLDELLKSHGPLVGRRAAEIAASIGSALACAHEAGVIHRDVKSSNILIERGTESAKITDFGLARAVDADSQLTTEGMIAGTPAYMSPEQIIDPRQVDARSDVYSLGIVLYQMLTGMLPFRGTPRMTLMQVQHHEPTQPRQLNDQIPVDLETICLKAIAKEPERRYASASSLREDIQRYLENQPIHARRTGWIGRAKRWYRRNPSIAMLWTSVVVLFLIGLGIAGASAVRLSVALEELRDAERRTSEVARTASLQRDATIRTLRKLVTDVPKALDAIPEDTAEVEQLVSKIAIEGLAKVSAAGDDAEAGLPAAMGHYQLGATFWRVNQLEDAERHLQMGLAILDLANVDSKNRVERLELASNIHIQLANIDFDYGDRMAIRKHVNDGLSIVERLLKSEPSNFTARLNRAEFMGLLAECDIEDGQEEAAREHLADSTSLLNRLAAERPNSEEVMDVMDINHEIAGYLSSNLGGKNNGNGHRPSRTTSELNDLGPEELQDALAQSVSNANAATMKEDHNQEYDAIQRAHEVASILAAEAPTDANTLQLAEITLRMGHISREFGYPKDAHDFYRNVSQMVDAMESGAGERVDSLKQAAEIGVALTLADRGRYAKAEPMIREWIATLDKIDEPTVTDEMLQIDLSLGLTYVADLSRAELKLLLSQIRSKLARLESNQDAVKTDRWPLWRLYVLSEIELLAEDIAAR